ncbi:SMP-30/gluconolactonase/LRE family protein [Massiliimalia timonensis]|uniref:SMP-30/gluconolactonase/LRE family protein n=1 Tax=Massiliimalia timonensis TaxID=1987501 RepID=UPI000B8B79A8|nr:SMP-30/gluconolactonase/LRE family protein [Massiliimalia timonensis]
MLQAELFLKAGAVLAEGSVYDKGSDSLYWVDIDGRALHRTDLVTAHDQQWGTPSRIGMMRLMENGGICVALEDGLYQKTETGYTPLAMLPNRPGRRSNDGNCDANGRLWLGTMDLSGGNGGSLFRIDQGKVTEMVTDISCSNGLCFSHDNRCLYYIDTPSEKLWRFDFDLASGTVESRTALIDYSAEEGDFDGMTIDSQGQLWIAHWEGWKVSAWDPQTGKKQEEIRVPAPKVTCCTFAGKDFSTLYITTAHTEGIEGSGHLYACRDTGCRGQEFARYRP